MKDGKMTKEMLAAELDAEREGKFYARDLLCEIAPLIDEYFIYKTDGFGTTLNLRFCNGQRFELSVREV
ncbi:MAG: hypothetical protein K2N33_00160 [Clostridia bacterium]|nr:hypothetical protein [Clostridia bacterium]